jgi:hypothetical protein
MYGPWRKWFDAAQCAYEAQWVIALRMMHLAEGGPRAAAEAQRMVTEKVTALAAAQMAAAAALASGATPAAAAARALTPVKRRVRANRKRLMRRRKR